MELPVINLIDGIESSKGITMLLSEIAEDITFIPLETTDECLIGNYCVIYFFKDYIVTIDNIHQIFLFDKTGKYIRKIGNKGQGPGEYIHAQSPIIVNNELFIYDLSVGKTLCYDLLTGKCLRTTIHYDHNAVPQNVWCLNDSILVYYFSVPIFGDPKEFMHIRTLSLDFEITNKLWHEEFQSILNTSSKSYEPPESPIMYSKDGNEYMLDPNDENGIVYCINKKFEKIPAYQIYKGKYYFDEKSEKKSYNILSMIDTDRFVFFFGELLPNHYARFILYDKATNESKHIISEFGPLSGFHNDIDGSIPFWPNGIVSRNVLYDAVTSYKLKELMSHPCYKTFEIKNKEKHQAIKDYVDSAKEDDNPVIFLVTLKTK
jgi:hypothetical protein